jgi:DNA polymerase III delta prime subunit
MEQIIGQSKLVNKLKTYTFVNMPKTLLFIGSKGAGKHFISSKFANYLNVELVEITSQTTSEQLIEYYQSSIPKIYLIDLSTIVEKQQHKYLKFIEEPSSNMRVILLAESEIGILPTVLNRCIKYTFEDYTIDQLKQFNWAAQIENELAYTICNTPGQLLNLSSADNLTEMQSTCEELIHNISAISYVDLLNYNNKINYENEFNKFDFNLFLNLLIKTAYDNYLKTNNKVLFDVYRYLIKRNQQLVNKTLAKEAFMLNTLDRLWRLTH